MVRHLLALAGLLLIAPGRAENNQYAVSPDDDYVKVEIRGKLAVGVIEKAGRTVVWFASIDATTGGYGGRLTAELSMDYSKNREELLQRNGKRVIVTGRLDVLHSPSSSSSGYSNPPPPRHVVIVESLKAAPAGQPKQAGR